MMILCVSWLTLCPFMLAIEGRPLTPKVEAVTQGSAPLPTLQMLAIEGALASTVETVTHSSSHEDAVRSRAASPPLPAAPSGALAIPMHDVPLDLDALLALGSTRVPLVGLHSGVGGDSGADTWAVVGAAVTMGAFAAQGPRDHMEDRHLLMTGMMPGHLCQEAGSPLPFHLVGVFDGHRGAAAAEHAKQRLASAFLEALERLPALPGAAASAEVRGVSSRSPLADALGSALRHAFLTVDVEFRRAEEKAWLERLAAMGEAAAGARVFPGATAVAAVAAGGEVVVANAGDCRAVLSRGRGAMALSRDHNTGNEDEIERVRGAGARLRLAADGWRIGDVGLQVTRSIGDADVKGGECWISSA